MLLLSAALAMDYREPRDGASVNVIYWLCICPKEGRRVSFLAWIVLGLIAGFIGSKIVNKRGEGLILDILLGIVGAIVGGWLAGLAGFAGVSGVNIYSLVIAVIGAIVVLVVYHAIRRTA
jgi:uncharacterized membrane protein YeaQ/YmgE (transglycosylase-associated protein family)